MPPSLPVADGVYERAFIFEMAGPTLDFLAARREALLSGAGKIVAPAGLDGTVLPCARR
jgi:hypothetical protein